MKDAVDEALKPTVLEELQLQAATAATRALDDELNMLEEEPEADELTPYYGVQRLVQRALRLRVGSRAITARQTHLCAACPFGRCLRARTASRILALTDSIAFDAVVSRRSSDRTVPPDPRALQSRPDQPW